MRKSSEVTKTIVYVGLFAALLSVLSQIAIPLPTQIPITLQTFAVALTGYFLGVKKGTAAVLVYVLLGAVGVPVFAGWSGGFGVITGLTGGFIYGFIVMGFFCGLGSKFNSKKLSGKVISVAMGIIGLAFVDFFGALQFGLLSKNSIGKSFLLAVAPYLVKDIISVVCAYLISEELVKRLAKSGCYAVKTEKTQKC